MRLPGEKQIVIDSKVPSSPTRRRARGRNGRRAPRPVARSCTPRARAHPAARPEGVLATAAGDARVRRHVPSGRVVPARHARAGRIAHRACCLEQRHPRVTHEPHRPSCARSPLRLAAGNDRRERQRGKATDESCTRPSRPWGRTWPARKVARRLGQGLQRDGRPLERQVLVQARRFERHGITGIEQPSYSRSSASRGRLLRPSSPTRPRRHQRSLQAPTQPREGTRYDVKVISSLAERGQPSEWRCTCERRSRRDHHRRRSCRAVQRPSTPRGRISSRS